MFTVQEFFEEKGFLYFGCRQTIIVKFYLPCMQLCLPCMPTSNKLDAYWHITSGTFTYAYIPGDPQNPIQLINIELEP